MSDRFYLPDGTEIRTGLNQPDAPANALAMSYPVYGEEFYLEKNEIEKLLKGDVYKTFRRRRSKWVLNQNGLGKCNASATVNAFHNRRDIDGLPHVALSDCFLYMHINGGGDNGSLLVDGLKWASENGIAPRKLKVDGQEVVFPHNVYNTRQVSAKLLQAAKAEAPNYLSWEAYRLPTDDYKTYKIALASALARDHQVVFAWHVGNSSMNLRNGYAVVGRGPGNHATLFHSAKWVGGEDLVHPDCENSWGPSKDPLYGPVGQSGWGEDGFGLFTMQDSYACTKYHQFWVFVGNKLTKPRG